LPRRPYHRTYPTHSYYRRRQRRRQRQRQGHAAASAPQLVRVRRRLHDGRACARTCAQPRAVKLRQRAIDKAGAFSSITSSRRGVVLFGESSTAPRRFPRANNLGDLSRWRWRRRRHALWPSRGNGHNLALTGRTTVNAAEGTSHYKALGAARKADKERMAAGRIPARATAGTQLTSRGPAGADALSSSAAPRPRPPAQS